MSFPRYLAFLYVLLAMVTPAHGAELPTSKELEESFADTVRPFLKAYCLDCHGAAKPEAKLDLSPFASLEAVEADLGHWQLVLERLAAGEMPPEDAVRQPSAEQRDRVTAWVRAVRDRAARRNAEDPGLVLPRRLNNAEFNWTIRDLTGVDIRPADQFPVDPANVAGFANSGESLAMSPALLGKYLAAARHVSEHLVLLPDGITFAPHPAVVYSDRDKFAVRRVIDFYESLQTDYAPFLLAAWHYKHRAELGAAEATLEDMASRQGVSPRYLQLLWQVLEDDENGHGPIAQLRSRWESLPGPKGTDGGEPNKACEDLRNWIVRERKKRQFSFPLVMIPKLNPSTQPGILWKNELIAQHRRKGTMTDEERDSPELKAAIERFCSVFPDQFMLTERGRMNLPFEMQNKGRLLNAGFHLQIGYYRDDDPLVELILNESQAAQLDQLWRELVFVTDVPVRQFQDYLYFERAEGREVITEEEFDFVRAEDRSVTRPESIQKIGRLYLAAVRKRGLSEEALASIQRYYDFMTDWIADHERSLIAAEPIHLQSLLEFAARAWRRPLSASEADDLLQFYRELREANDLTHEAAVRDVVTSILASPFFCYRVNVVEPSAQSDEPGVTLLTQSSLANRLSYFLWSSMPDRQLLQLAQEGKLREKDVLTSQVHRMLQDDRARALAIEFAGHWLDFRHFRNHVGVDREKFTQFTDELRDSMFGEPVEFFADWIRRDGTVSELLDTEHTFVDATLARHYGIPFSRENASDRGWMRIENARTYGRGGLLPMALFLTQSSPGQRTSPVKRGYWVVKQLLGEHIPAPPADVPDLPQSETELGDLTLREVLASHRENKSCATCHEKFDFAGIVFEGYGPIGERREHDLGGRPVDTTTQLPDGSTGTGLAGLQSYLVEHRRAQFEETLCRKLLAYGLGRSLQLSDEPTIDRMKETLRQGPGRFSDLVKVVATSRQFLHGRSVVYEDDADDQAEVEAEVGAEAEAGADRSQSGKSSPDDVR